jgi:hypothetical protein
MAFKTKEKLDWTDVDVDELSPKLAKLYATYRKDQALANKSREAFDAEFKKSATEKLKIDPSEQSVKVGHAWGKLSYAVANEATKGVAKKVKVFF